MCSTERHVTGLSARFGSCRRGNGSLYGEDRKVCHEILPDYYHELLETAIGYSVIPDIDIQQAV